ncbi:MAG: HEAT repeat domain-containing protein [Planctomycetota bacterium]
MLVKWTIAAAAALLGSCAPAATEGGFDSANPAAKLYAIEQAARAGDSSAAARIVEQLDSDDPAVRMLAIAALERLTGETYGYRYYDPPYLRRAAVERWVGAVKSGRLPQAGNTTGRSFDDNG